MKRSDDYTEYDTCVNTTYEVTARITLRVRVPEALIGDPIRRAYWTPAKGIGEFLWYIGDMAVTEGGHIEGLTEAESRHVDAEVLDVEIEDCHKMCNRAGLPGGDRHTDNRGNERG